MTVETPQPRDRVRWQRTSVIEGVVEEITADGIVVRDGDGYKHLCQVDDVTVEVLERADDPSQDLTGSIRHTGTVTCIARERDGGPDYHRWIAVELNESYADEHMRRSRVIGAVPGTPAAEAQEQWRHCDTCECIHPPCGYVMGSQGCDSVCDQTAARLSVRVPNEPHGPAAGVLQLVREELTQGHALAAVNLLKRATGWSLDEAREYVESMSEYQAHLSEHGRTEVDPTEARRMRAMGFDKQPEFTLTDDDRAEIGDALEQRRKEFSWRGHDGERTVDMAALAGVVADIVYAVRVQDRKRGDR